jgi:predicted nucleic-acid-binding protein
MKALDTNVLIRFLVRDDPPQADMVYRRFKQAEYEKEVFFIPQLVVLEILWVLEAVYKTPRMEIMDSIEALFLMPILQWESPAAIQGLIASAKTSRGDLSDLFIAQSAKCAGCDAVLTFDQEAVRFGFFEKLR